MQGKDWHLSSVPLSPSRYLRPVYRSVQPFSVTPKANTSRVLYATANYRRVKSKDLSPYTLPRFGRMDQPLRETRRREKMLQELRVKQRELSAKAEETHRRKQLFADICTHFSVSLSRNQLINKSEVEVTEVALKKVCNRINEESSRKIQRTWRKIRTKRLNRQLDLKSNAAARLIQRAWRHYHTLKTRQDKEHKAAVTIQRYLRGAL